MKVGLDTYLYVPIYILDCDLYHSLISSHTITHHHLNPNPQIEFRGWDRRGSYEMGIRMGWGEGVWYEERGWGYGCEVWERWDGVQNYWIIYRWIGGVSEGDRKWVRGIEWDGKWEGEEEGMRFWDWWCGMDWQCRQ